MECRQCNLCNPPGQIDSAPEVKKVRSNIRQFRNEEFTVWRCSNCGSLHCLEDIDFARYYRNYPLHRQKADFFTLKQFSSRLHQLVTGGLMTTDSVLDYGCGNGGFVRFLKAQGYSLAVGYDPYSESFSDRAVLERNYDFVISQDVIEHAPDTLSLLDEMLTLVRAGGGMAVIGTPDAAEISLDDPIDVVGPLHQPYHRHILTKAQLENLIEARGLNITKVLQRWYVDTWIPFLNSSFFFHYVAATGGAVDSIFEPIRYPLILGSPKLLVYGLFGRLRNPRKDVLIFAQAK